MILPADESSFLPQIAQIARIRTERNQSVKISRRICGQALLGLAQFLP
jgi:hypothetical protein